MIVINEVQMRLLLACANTRHCEVCATAIRRLAAGRTITRRKPRPDPGE